MLLHYHINICCVIDSWPLCHLSLDVLTYRAAFKFDMHRIFDGVGFGFLCRPPSRDQVHTVKESAGCVSAAAVSAQ